MAYQQKQAVNPADLFTEVGTTGVPNFMGMFADRHLEVLRGPQGIEKMATVLRKEPAAFTLNAAIALTARQAKWKVVGASDKPADRRASEFVESCLHDMSTDWSSVVQFSLTGMAFGFSDLGIVFKRRLGKAPSGGLPASAFSDGYIGLKKMPIRRQETIERWELDEHGDLRAMVQRDPTTGQLYPPVPIEKLLHFKFGNDRGSPEGVGWLEPAYRLAKMIENLEIIYGVGQQRAHVGLPIFKFLVNPDANTKAAVERTARNLVVNEQQFVTYPGEVVEFNLMSVTNPSAAETREMISQLRWEIMMAGLGQFLRLGSTASGSRALADPLIVMFISGVDGGNNEVASVFNRHLIPRLMAANPTLANGIDQYPQLQPSSAQPPPDVMAYLTAIQAFMNQASPEDQVWLRTMVGMPEMTVAEIQRREEEAQQQVAQQDGQQQGNGGNQGQNDQQQGQQGDQQGQGAQGQEDPNAQAGLTPREAFRLASVADEFRQAAVAFERMANGNGANGHR